MMTLTIPNSAVLPLWLAVFCGIIALLAVGGVAISREVSHWSDERAQMLRKWLSLLQLLALIAGGILVAVAVLIFIAEAPRG